MMKQLKVGFLGYGTKALDYLMQDTRFCVKAFIVPEKRLCQEVYEAKQNYTELPFYLTKDNNDLERIFSSIIDIDCVVMNACPIILNEATLQNIRVFNIHPGNLNYNRGHHPHLWTVLLNETTSNIVLHKVTPKIDLGEIIGNIQVPIGEEENAGEVLEKLECFIPNLLDKLYEHLVYQTKPIQNITQGAYRRAMTYEDYEIQLTDQLKQIKRKILARSMHHGAFLKQDGVRYYVDAILHIFNREVPALKEEKITFLIEKENEQVIINTREEKIILHLGKIEICET